MIGQKESLFSMTSGHANTLRVFLPWILILAALTALASSNFLAFHTLAELFSIIIGFSFFMVIWNGRRFLDNHYLLFLGIAFLFISFLDLIHALTYNGMPDIFHPRLDSATQIWIAARYLEGIALLGGFYFIRHKVYEHWVLAGFLLIVTLIMASILWWDVFPRCYLPDSGQTPFKIYSEYLIALLYGLALLLLRKHSSAFNPDTIRFLGWAIAASICMELCFTLWNQFDDIFNRIGHLLKVMAFYWIYRAVVETAMNKPYSVLFREITHASDELLRLNQELSTSRALLQLVLDTFPARIFWKNTHGTYLGCNSLFASDVGLPSPMQLAGKNDHDLQLPEPYHRLLIAAPPPQPQTAQLNQEISLTMHGEQRWWKISRLPLSSLDADTIGQLTILEEISDRMALELDKQAAMEKAEQANRAKSDFLANMSHEIRTPMNAIINLSHLLMHSNLDKRQKDYLDTIQCAGRALLRLIDDILDLSKIEAGRMHLEQTAFNLDEVLRQLAAVAGLLNHKGLELIFQTAPETPRHFLGDPHRLEQILRNLLGNAIKFTEHGHVLLLVECLAVPQPGAQAERVTLQFTVRDTGIGLSQEQIDKLFQNFTQADSSITRKYGGTGLGLAISKRLAELMGGALTMHSILGQGSDFILTCPFSLDTSPEEHPPLQHPQLQGLRLLLIDDNPIARSALATILQTFQVAVTGIGSGHEAEQLLCTQLAHNSHTPFELLILDLEMPEQDGFATLQRLQQLPVPQRPPIILMSNQPLSVELHARAVRLGATVTMVKPISASLLLEKIYEAISDLPELKRRQLWVLENDLQQALQQLQPARILVVEDHEVNQMIVRELLLQHGFTPTFANHGQEALQLLNNRSFDLIFMDIQMPVLDGLETTRRIRTQKNAAHIPIIAMTAHAMKVEVERCLAAGMNDHLPKPIDPKQLYRMLVQWLRVPQNAPTPPRIYRQEPLPESLLPIPGVDMPTGMARMAGNSEAYRRALQRFARSCRENLQIWEDDPTPTEKDSWWVMLHSLKGLAGNLGVITLFQMAQGLEQQRRHGAMTDSAPLRSAMLEIITAIEQALPEFDEGACAVQPLAAVADPEQVCVLLRQVHRLAEEEFSAIPPLVAQLATLLHHTHLQDLTNALQQQMEAFDIAMIQQVTEQMQQELARPIPPAPQAAADDNSKPTRREA
ncbi:MAG: response regulator [Magnetococcales bacterium]|nr:response regulator [Magnetococcales bacterium]MBF0115328.1 response regulator [Magnetococcales bacterium]